MSLTGDRLEELVLEIGALRSELEKRPRLVWGVVTSSSPLRVRIDGDSSSTAAAGSASGAPTVGSRVYCSLQNGRLTVLTSPEFPEIPEIPEPVDLTPAGTITAFGGATAPAGYALCDGQPASPTAYPELFAAIGYSYGQIGSNFRVPDLRGRVPVGLDTSQSDFDTLGKTGGAATHTLTVAQMPSHNHGGSTASSTVGAGFSNASGSGTPDTSRVYHGNDDTARYQSSINSSAHTHTIPSQGGGGEHNNLQPYNTVNYIIKT